MTNQKKTSVLPQVRYHPSIQPSRLQTITTKKNVEITNARSSSASVHTTVDDPSPSPVSTSLQGAKAEDRVQYSRKQNVPHVRYHPSIKTSQDCVRNGRSQNFTDGLDDRLENATMPDEARDLLKSGEIAGREVLDLGATSFDQDGSPLESDGAKSQKVTKTSKLNVGHELQRTNRGIGPEDTSSKGIRPENPNVQSTDGSHIDGATAQPQKARGRKARNSKHSRWTLGDGQELRDPKGELPPQVPGGLQGLRLDTLDPGSPLDRSEVERVEVLTRGQRTNPDWFRFRRNRITASVAHVVANCGFANGKTTTPPASYLRSITGEGPRVQTRAMTWGIDHEREVVQKYQESSSLGRPVSVLDCGLILDRYRPWLAASPDGIVIDGRTGQWLRCLEVKCPFKHREGRVEQACREDPLFCLEILSDQHHGERRHHGQGQFSLRRSHPYFTQVQCQMAVTGLKMADFVVWTKRDLVSVEIRFDPDFWSQTVSRLDRFYHEALVPYLRERTPHGHSEL